VGCFLLGGAVGADVAVAQVIHEDDDDVGLGLGERGQRGEQESDEEGEGGVHGERWAMRGRVVESVKRWVWRKMSVNRELGRVVGVHGGAFPGCSR